MAFPFAEARPVSFLLDVIVMVPSLSSSSTGRPRTSSYATLPSSSSNARMLSGEGAGSGENHAVESTRGYAVTLGAPPLRGTRCTRHCGPANAALDAACVLEGEGCSPFEQDSNTARQQDSKTAVVLPRCRAVLAFSLLRRMATATMSRIHAYPPGP